MKKPRRPGLHPQSPTIPAAPTAAAESVLLVEDDPLIARAVQRHLSKNGFAVARACRAEEILGLNQTFALGVFDIHLPERNGVDLARLCLAQGIVKRVVFYSSAEPGALREMAEHMGDFIEKQAGVTALVEKVLKAYKPTLISKRLLGVG